MIENELIIQNFQEQLVLSGFSDGTIKAYRLAAIRFLNYFDKPIHFVSSDEIRAYFLQMLNEQNVSSSYYNQVLAGLNLLQQTVLKRPWPEIKPIKKRASRKLPVAVSQDEVIKILDAVADLKHKTILTVIYSAGLRLSEALQLKPSDIDGTNMVIRITGKGDKDRYTILAEQTLKLLRIYWRQYRPNLWLFPGQNPNNYIAPRTVQRALKSAIVRSGIKKQRIGCHTLRHCFSNHLYLAGVDIHTIQKLLGHSNLNTTTIYTNIEVKDISKVKSPLDQAGDAK